MSSAPTPPATPGAGPPGQAPAHPPGSVATFRAGDVVRGTYACTRKDRLTAKTGTTYLAVELRDRTGAIGGRVFRDADLVASRFDRGDLVHVQAKVERFRDELQLDIAQIARAPTAEADPASFLPVAYRDMEELDGFLEHLAREVHDPGYRGVLERLLADEPLRTALRRTPCSRAGHHAYLGGLLEHTVAVATLAQEASLLHPRLNSDLLICAAIVHDLGHTQSFDYGAEITLSEAGRLLGHVELGLRIVDRLTASVPAMDTARRLQLAHCVLTHHGPDAAPGRRFGSVEALALARLNTLDAGIKGALEHGLQ
ncbi:3'-5' exoribonuclease YhaM [Paraconexibacter sp. AEG42_29]|uniref:3'-5' exoribonuclease YhaM n=1 Tax=Paraconexibacter sp. AEG42_29 TaxID=2997339 RepID=A0AAU7B368_9ACTN